MAERKSYWELLRDPRWQRKRLEVMEHAGFACGECTATDKTLNVHHKHYRKGAKPWEYEAFELECLCEECHLAKHRLREQLDRAISQLPAHMVEFVLGYVHGKLALNQSYAERDTNPCEVLSDEHAEGLMDAMWNWNAPGSRPMAACLCDHGRITNRLLDALGDGELPEPKGL